MHELRLTLLQRLARRHMDADDETFARKRLLCDGSCWHGENLDSCQSVDAFLPYVGWLMLLQPDLQCCDVQSNFMAQLRELGPSDICC